MMQLRYSQTSPYVRKVMMVAFEAGVADRIEISPTDVWAPDTPIVRDNPLSKIPTLVTEDGLVLFDSPVIAEYLDSLGGGVLFPATGNARWKALRQQALADGICDASVLRLLEGRRPESLRSADWADRQRRAVTRALDLLEREVTDLPPADAPTIGGIAVLAALGYLDFRFAKDGWRQGRPGLANWFEAASARDSFKRTAPPSE